MKRVYRLSLTHEERLRLEDVVSSATANRTIATRCRILLAADESCGNGSPLARADIASLAETSLRTVTTTIKKYLHGGLDEVLNLKRSERSNFANLKATEAVKDLITEISNSTPPEGRRQWSVRRISRELIATYGVQLSKSTVYRVKKAP